MKRRNFLGAAVGTVGAITGLRLVPEIPWMGGSRLSSNSIVAEAREEIRLARYAFTLDIPPDLAAMLQPQRDLNGLWSAMLDDIRKETDRQVMEIIE